MKSHFSLIVGILLGVVLLLGMGSFSVADPPQKGIVTVGLIRGLGLNLPPKLEERSGLASNSAPAKAVHRANIIPTTVSGSGVRQTSGEELPNDSLVSDLTVELPEMTLDPASSSDPAAQMTLDEPEMDLADAQLKDALPGPDQDSAASNQMEVPNVQTVENLSALDGENKTVAAPQGEAKEMSLTPLQDQDVSEETASSAHQLLSLLNEPPASAPMNDMPPMKNTRVSSFGNELKKAESTDFAADFGSSTVTEGSGKPGEAAIEGVQLSRLSIQKTAPEEIQVGQPAVWTISVRNESKITAVGVQIHDVIPQGTRLESTNPPADVSPSGEITWNVGNMPSGTMATVRMELTPIREGEIGSVASVTSRSESSAKSIATRPMLKVETFGDSVVLIGSKTELNIVVSNPGTGTARDVVLSETVPPEL
nr:DUF11 domain-containing protein [Thermoguttaceae bacterium]